MPPPAPQMPLLAAPWVFWHVMWVFEMPRLTSHSACSYEGEISNRKSAVRWCSPHHSTSATLPWYPHIEPTEHPVEAFA